MSDPYEQMLTGGHPNSLGRTVDVVESVLADPSRMEELFLCYQSTDEVVRLRTSSALKRVEGANHHLLLPYIDRLIGEIGHLDQASAQWTLATLFDRLADDMSDTQRTDALAIMKRNLAEHSDWIVLNTTMDVLVNWAKTDAELAEWLRPHLNRLSGDPRKSVSRRSDKLLEKLDSY